MNKAGAVAIVVSILAIVYIILLVVMPIVSDFASSANTTFAAIANVSDYPGSQGALLSAPWILYFAPAVIGMIVIVSILKQG